jgi:hypothetical protein
MPPILMDDPEKKVMTEATTDSTVELKLPPGFTVDHWLKDGKQWDTPTNQVKPIRGEDTVYDAIDSNQKILRAIVRWKPKEPTNPKLKGGKAAPLSRGIRPQTRTDSATTSLI